MVIRHSESEGVTERDKETQKEMVIRNSEVGRSVILGEIDVEMGGDC